MRRLIPAEGLDDGHGARMPRGLILLLTLSLHLESARGALRPASRSSRERGVLAWS